MNLVIVGMITKEQGRQLIKKTPIELFQKICDFSKRAGSKNSKFYHIERLYDKYDVVTNSLLEILSLFNDECVFCHKVFTHYVIGMSTSGSAKRYQLYPVRLETNGEIIYYNIDHIMPQSLGGANRLENYQLSCEDLNRKKGNILSDEDKKYGVMVQQS